MIVLHLCVINDDDTRIHGYWYGTAPRMPVGYG